MAKHILNIVLLICVLGLIISAGYYSIIDNNYSKATFDLVLGLSIYYNVKSDKNG